MTLLASMEKVTYCIYSLEINYQLFRLLGILVDPFPY